jgi:hypothetical protein
LLLEISFASLILFFAVGQIQPFQFLASSVFVVVQVFIVRRFLRELSVSGRNPSGNASAHTSPARSAAAPAAEAATARIDCPGAAAAGGGACDSLR